MNELTERNGEILFYTTSDGSVKMKVIFQDETVWMTQKMIAELFEVQVPAISKHINNIFNEHELERDTTISILETVQKEGSRNVRRKKEFYNLDVIIAVGYRVNSKRATHFRIWATNTLREFIIKGFALDDERMKNGQHFGKDYFRELLERVRSIRASERRIYQQITDVFAECSIDYDPNSDLTKNFYAMIQNKFHFAITGHTAAEIIFDHADKQLPHMGLQTWKNSPDGRILKSDVKIAKNYLTEDEIKKLERAITAYFDYIERLIENRTAMTMESLSESVDKFLNFNEYNVLQGKGKISHKQAIEKAFDEYSAFNKTQKIHSDFDKFLELQNKLKHKKE